jgi:hypothetical protein
MANTFYVRGSYRTVKVLDGSTTLDIQYVNCVTIPTGIGFAYGVPYASWQGGSGPGIGILDSIAGQLELLASGHHVVAGMATQDLDANGLLQDFASVVVEYDRGPASTPLQTTVDVPVDLLVYEDPGIGGFRPPPPPGQVSPGDACDAAYAGLAALAGA